MQISGTIMDSVVDGSGVRMTIFTQGCPHHCKGCHNPETWSYEKEVKTISVQEIFNLFDTNSILAGITLSGGEPLSPRNFEEIIEIGKELKKRGKNLWVYTGYTIEEVLNLYPNLKEDFFPYVTVLVDGAFKLEQKDLLCKFRGSSNQRLIDVQKYLNKKTYFLYD